MIRFKMNIDCKNIKNMYYVTEPCIEPKAEITVINNKINCNWKVAKLYPKSFEILIFLFLYY